MNQSAKYALSIHGGAGALRRDLYSKADLDQYTQELERILEQGARKLEQGQKALDVVEFCVQELEDCPLFNAGRGSVFNKAGQIEMDASIMDGATKRAGAVGVVKLVKNPISLARFIMEKTPHVYLSGIHAQELARAQGLPLCPEEYFFVQKRWEQFLKLSKDRVELDHGESPSSHTKSDPSPDKMGTVGAVALDKAGHLAAATSTGGMNGKLPGRVSDSSVIGAGTYADNSTCAVSTTGIGEYFIRNVTAHQISCLIKYQNHSLDSAVQAALSDLKILGGEGGVIAVNTQGKVTMAFNSAGMFRASLDGQGQKIVAIYGDDAI